MLLKRSILLLGIAWLPTVCDASLVYQLVNYPDLQNGYTLDGTITVADTAAEDGLLAVEEILDWSWTASGQRSLEGRYQAEPFVDHQPTRVSGIEIDANGIYLPLGNAELMVLEEYTNPGRAANRRILGWSGGDAQRLNRYTLNLTDEGDIATSAWGATLPIAAGRWLIATQVPEPKASISLAVCLTALLYKSLKSPRSINK